MKNQHVWQFPSKGLKAIWDHEIVGQLSDGAWENGSPSEHWRFWGHLSTVVGDAWKFTINPNAEGDHYDRYPQKRSGYNLVGELTDPEMIDLSPRMRAYYIDAESGIGLGRQTDYLLAGGFDCKAEALTLEEFNKNKQRHTADGTYWVKLYAELEAVPGGIEAALSKLQDGLNRYSRKDLINSLREIKREMGSVLQQILR